MRKAWLVIAAIGVVCSSLQAASVSYMGSLAYNKEIAGADGTLFVTGAGDWRWSVTKVAWTVSQSASCNLWHYEYTITVPRTSGFLSDVQCVIVEAADGMPNAKFTDGNLFSPASSPAAWLQQVEIGSYSQFSDSTLVNLTKTLYGIEFATANIDPTHLTIGFDSDCAPVWGDFYARSYIIDGEVNVMVNDDLAKIGADTDPSAPAANGSVGNHVLVPGYTSCIPVPPSVPVPGAVVLGMLGISCMPSLRRRRWL